MQEAKAKTKTKAPQRPITTWEQVPILMDTAYVAMLLGITQSEVRAMARTGELPAVRPGKRAWRFEKSALMNALGIR